MKMTRSIQPYDRSCGFQHGMCCEIKRNKLHFCHSDLQHNFSCDRLHCSMSLRTTIMMNICGISPICHNHIVEGYFFGLQICIRGKWSPMNDTWAWCNRYLIMQNCLPCHNREAELHSRSHEVCTQAGRILLLMLCYIFFGSCSSPLVMLLIITKTQHGITLFPALISNHIHYIVWNEISYPFPNFTGTAIGVW